MFENFEMKPTTVDPYIWLIDIFGRLLIPIYTYFANFLKDIFLPLRWRGIAFCKFSLFLKNGIGGCLCGCPVFLWENAKRNLPKIFGFVKCDFTVLKLFVWKILLNFIMIAFIFLWKNCDFFKTISKSACLEGVSNF